MISFLISFIYFFTSCSSTFLLLSFFTFLTRQVA